MLTRLNADTVHVYEIEAELMVLRKYVPLTHQHFTPLIVEEIGHQLNLIDLVSLKANRRGLSNEDLKFIHDVASEPEVLRWFYDKFRAFTPMTLLTPDRLFIRGVELWLIWNRTS